MTRFLRPIAPVLLFSCLVLPRAVARQAAPSPPAVAPPAAGASLIGFTPDAAAAERHWEQMFQQIPKPDSLRESLRTLTAKPHMAGTPADRATAEYVASVFRQAGLDTQVIAYSARLPYPRQVKIELVSPERRELPNYEEPVAGDPFSQMKDAVVGFNAYSPSGDVTAPVVYANYGLEDDYAELAKQGIDVKGKIVLVRYGKSYRGIKSELAAKAGAVGVLIYSDPNDDGYHAGDVYPGGPYRPASGIQRGSILNGNYPGAPLAPGQQPDAAEEAAWKAVLPTLPTLPIAYQAAEPILMALKGPSAPPDWQGGLPFTYHLGGDDQTRVHMHLDMDVQYRTIWDVIGTLRGSGTQEVILGNHRDGWTFGAVDPDGGAMVQLEIARALGQLHRAGWTPLRTIVLCSWDAEEFDLIGSTDWANQNLDSLRQHAVAYINSDEGDSGPNFGADAVPSLSALIRSVTASVPNLTTHATSVYQDWLKLAQDHTPAGKTPPQTPPIGVLGGGSDFEPYLGHVGLASADIGFKGHYGVYHALFDDFHYFSTESDPQFLYGEQETDVKGLLAMRLADAPLVPLDLPAYAQAITDAINQLRAATTAAPASTLDWQGTLAAAARLQTAADAFTERSATALAQAKSNPQRLAQFNDALAGFDQNFLLPQGLPGRPYFEHLIYAPEITRGYSAAVLPGVSERLQQKDWEGAQVQRRYLRQALERAANALDAVR